MKILVAIDSSPYSDAAVNEVSRRVWPADAEICVFSVVDVTRFGVIGTEGGQWTAALTEAAEQSVKAAVERLKPSGLKVEGKVMLGSPGGAICDYAQDWRADFIFVGSHGRTGLSRLLLGSVSRAVIHRAPCSVVVARPHQRDSAARAGLAILLATDGSECSALAARSVADRKWREAARVTIISVAEVPDISVSPEYIDIKVIEQMREAAQATASQAVDSAKAIFSGSGLQVEAAAILGDPKSVILEEAERIKSDLIVVGSHGRRGINRVLLGSVSEAVAAGAHCSVEIIR